MKKGPSLLDRYYIVLLVIAVAGIIFVLGASLESDSTTTDNSSAILANSTDNSTLANDTAISPGNLTPSAGDCLSTITQACSDDPSISCSSDADCGDGNTCDTVQTNPDCPAPESVQASETAYIASLNRLGSDCSFPGAPNGSIVQKGSQCVLTSDITINATIAPDSSTKLNCQGHAISPSSQGLNITVRSAPEVGILLNNVSGVRIQNCNISGFDFGIFAINSKVNQSVRDAPGTLELLSNNLVNNTVDARYVAVDLVSVDNTRIKDSAISFRTGGGIGIFVQRNSDLNQIKNNDVTANLSNDNTGVVLNPGPGGSSNPVFAASSAGADIAILQVPGNHPSIFNALINGTLYQLPISDSPVPDQDFTSDNTVEGNTVIGTKTTVCVNLAISQDTRVLANNLTNCLLGVQVGAQYGISPPRLFPGACSLDQSRLCLSNGDCNITGYDTASEGTCVGAYNRTVYWATNNTEISGNTITGPFNTAIIVAGADTSIQNNSISGPLYSSTNFGPSTGAGAGVFLQGKLALQTTNITRNVISNVPAPIRLSIVPTGNAISNALNANITFGDVISLNDFTGYSDEVISSYNATNTLYNLSSELSADSLGNVCTPTSQGCQGNYWGLACPGFDRRKAVSYSGGAVLSDGTVLINGTPNQYISDSHPYGFPVSQVYNDTLLNMTCGCPAGTVQNGSKCVLQNDVDLSVLNQTMDIGSFTDLDCQGHAIYTSRPGTDINHRSQPELALFLRQAYGATVENCNISGFDFGIIAINSKVNQSVRQDPAALESLSNNLQNNDISSRYDGISLFNVDNTRIKNNSITFSTLGALGVIVSDNSDLNQITGNRIATAINDTSGAVFAPGPVLASNPVQTSSILAVITGGTINTLFSSIIEGALYQIPRPTITVMANGVFPEDNIIEGNTMTADRNTSAIGVTGSLRTNVSRNNISDASVGITLGAINYGVVRQFPGTCSLAPSRLCLANSDCNISGIDFASKGNCIGINNKTLFWVSNHTLVENNTVSGPFLEGITVASDNALVRGNTITGPVFNSTSFAFTNGNTMGSVAFDMRKLGLADAIITRNTVSNVPVIFGLLNNNPSFGASISLNDFTNYTAEIVAVTNYTVASEFSDSAAGRGNYWGSGGCPGFDITKVLSNATVAVDSSGNVYVNGTDESVFVSPYIADGHAYNVSVANTPDSMLPAPCQ